MSHAAEVGIGANTLGLIFACLIGGPIARFLIQRHNLRGAGADVETGNLEVGVSHNQQLKNFDYMSLLFAWLIIHLSLIVGYFLNLLLADLGLMLPLFVSCLIGGIIIGNIGPLLANRFKTPETHMGLALMADMSLGLFLTMALMSMKLWLLSGMFTFILTAVALQALLTVLFSLFLVFPLMGKDYEASVIAAGFGGITLGSTATAIVNMKSVAEEYGPAHRAFIIVPLVCGFFIDLVNAVVIGYFLG
jgi:ESS family glutamate:Na+ symporter